MTITTDQRGKSRALGAKLGLALMAIVVFAAPMLITLNLKHDGDRGIQAQVDLQGVITELGVQDGLEWRAISGRAQTQEVRAGLVASRQRSGTLLKGAVSRGLPPDTADHIAATTTSYSAAVDEEVRLLSLGRDSEALEVDESRVDPAFVQASKFLRHGMDQLSERGGKGQSYSDFGVLLTVLLSLIMVSVVQSLRRRAQVRDRARRQGEARYRTLIDQAADLVLVLDRTGNVTFASPSVDRLFEAQVPDSSAGPHAPPEAPQVDFVTALDPQDRERFSTFLQGAAPGRMAAAEFRVNGKDGAAVCEMTVRDLTEDPTVGGLVVTAHDVTDRLVLQHEMEHLALHDALTGLPNRALLADRFEHALRCAERSGTSVGLLLLDLDRFKEVNDTFGHHYGDELLCQIGPRLAGVLRGADTVARLGGDEFAVLVPDLHQVGDATTLAMSLLAALSIPFNVEGVDMDVEASIGVVISGEHGQDAVTLMQHADIAMYVAKEQHLGVFAYDPTVNGHSATKLAMVGDLRRALDRHELVLYYQPKVSISTGELVGAEALVRWQHPELGLVFPDDFIPLAERTGLINPLTRYVLDSALAQARVWFDDGRPVPIAVNLSARNLHDDALPGVVAGLLATHDVPAHLLELEVTESAIMIDPERATQIMRSLSALGIRISLDDFGAGYTSLSQLTNMPIDEIKIDRQFVMAMAENPSNALIVSSVVDLGHNLGMTLVAEGVETDHDLSALAGFGCDIAQGYLLSRPVPVAAFNAWAETRHMAPPDEGASSSIPLEMKPTPLAARG
jgi:diguanylate cyclase (GGDEF)-like protein